MANPAPEEKRNTWRVPFERQEMVCWFQPAQMLRTALRVLFADAVTSLVDIRESQAALPHLRFPNDARLDPPQPRGLDPFDLNFTQDPRRPPRASGGVWIDVAADVGDGWLATYPVAELIGRESLQLRGLDQPLMRANVLALAGDCVYPTPSIKQYRDRLEGPFAAAFARTEDPNAPAPSLLAIPGNHDWYDGLMSFTRIFCRGRAIGGWQTRQRRSYFAVKLPGNWSLWGTDIQLDTPIDRPQLDYFEEVARELKADNVRRKVPEMPRIIILASQPAWLSERHGYQKAAANYWRFHRIARTNGCDPWVTFSGDLHHYARYVSRGDRQLITVGGGGSFVNATHDLPPVVRSPDPSDESVHGSAAYEKWRESAGAEFVESGFTFPRRTDSRRLMLRTLAFPFLSRNWRICALFGALYAAFPWMLRWATGRDNPSTQFVEMIRMLGSFATDWGGFREAWKYMGDAMWKYPVTWIPLALLVVAAVAFCRLGEPGKQRWRCTVWGGLHGLGHVVIAGTLAWLLAQLGDWSGRPEDHRLQSLLWLTADWVLGSLLCGLLLGIYLVVSARILGWHVMEVFSAQANPDFRSFVRMFVANDGELQIYPIGLRRVPRHWRARVGAELWQSRYESRDVVPEPELIEGPIIIRPR